jgi:class 3 adenylate cyclase
MDARDALRHYVPEQIAQKLLASDGTLEPVETEATILMCDIEGFAALTDALGPRGTFDFLNRYFELLVAIVERHGGVVTQFQGDAILAAFNVPHADADHAAQALRAALEIVRACDGGTCAGAHVRNRTGISSGRVIAGAVGSHGRLSYTVHGNPVNLAARLEMLNKEYGTRVLLCGKTAARCSGFKLRKIADAYVRGYAEPVALYTPADV